jgi:nucleotide-binding universal stress UspA family protein
MAEEPKVDTGRLFLLVADESEEFQPALRFAARRARRTGARLALLVVIDAAEFAELRSVEELMREERRQEAESMLNKVAAEAQALTGSMPLLFIREGEPRQELLALIDEEKSISILFLGASSGAKGPGPLVSELAGKLSGKLRVPVVVVPGSLTNEQIDALS